jgi:hypothetical protein
MAIWDRRFSIQDNGTRGARRRWNRREGQQERLALYQHHSEAILRRQSDAQERRCMAVPSSKLQLGKRLASTCPDVARAWPLR